MGLAAVALVLGVGDSSLFAQAQSPKTTVTEPKSTGDTAGKSAPTPSLEELLTKALRDNPDIRVAETKLREAEAELNRIRLQVMQKVVAYQHDLDMAARTLDEAKQRFKTVETLRKSASVSADEFRLAAQAVARFEADKAKIEAELPYLLGKQPAHSIHLVFGDQRPQQALAHDSAGNLYAYIPATGNQTDQLRKALDTPIKVEAKEVPLKDLLKVLEQKAPGVHFVMASSIAGAPLSMTLQLSETVPLAAILQAVEDDLGVRFVVRDYGVLVTGHAPAGAMSVQQFWKTTTRSDQPGR
jgi:hypothetical protein